MPSQPQGRVAEWVRNSPWNGVFQGGTPHPRGKLKASINQQKQCFIQSKSNKYKKLKKM